MALVDISSALEGPVGEPTGFPCRETGADPMGALLGALADRDVDAAVDGRRSALVHVQRVAGRPGRPGEIARPLPPEILACLGVPHLWSHQAEAIDLARAGRSVVVATGTASGKSLCYQVPIAEAALAPVRRGTALLVYPTKALAHDQLRALSER
ncbi:MAG: DEAD/DEAH box helicase, partial [Acidimicrobiales bacterium]